MCVSFDEVPPPDRLQLSDNAERPSREARASDKQVQWEAGHDPHTLNNAILINTNIKTFSTGYFIFSAVFIISSISNADLS